MTLRDIIISQYKQIEYQIVKQITLRPNSIAVKPGQSEQYVTHWRARSRQDNFPTINLWVICGFKLYDTLEFHDKDWESKFKATLESAFKDALKYESIKEDRQNVTFDKVKNELNLKFELNRTDNNLLGFRYVITDGKVEFKFRKQSED